MRTSIYIMLVIMIAFFSSCNENQVSPEKIFTKIGMNGNKIPRSFRQQFKEIRAHKAKGTLTRVVGNEAKTGVTALEFVDNHYADLLESDIEGIKALVSDAESKPIIDLGLEMFQFTDDIYKKDFPPIAKMIDEGKPNEEIDAAIENLDNTKGVALDEKYRKTMELLFPYVDKNGVKYEIYTSKY